MNKTLIGWREWVGLPDFGISAIKAKIDTGARTSSLHAVFTDRFRKNGEDWVRFGVHPLQKDRSLLIECEAPVIGVRVITDSGGHGTKRIIIATTLQLGPLARTVEISLANRKNMSFRMLIGRTAMSNQVIIDPARSFLTGGQPPRRHAS